MSLPLKEQRFPGHKCSGLDHFSDLGSERPHGEWFRHNLHPVVEATLVGDHILLIPGDEQYFEFGT